MDHEGDFIGSLVLQDGERPKAPRRSRNGNRKQVLIAALVVLTVVVAGFGA